MTLESDLWLTLMWTQSFNFQCVVTSEHRSHMDQCPTRMQPHCRSATLTHMTTLLLPLFRDPTTTTTTVFPLFPASVWNKTNWLQIQRSLSGWLTQERCREHGETVSVFCVDDLEPFCKYCAAVSHAELRVYLESEATFKHSRVFTKMNVFPSTFFKSIIVDTRSFYKKI